MARFYFVQNDYKIKDSTIFIGKNIFIYNGYRVSKTM